MKQQLKITSIQILAIIVFALTVAFFAGCRAITVENYGDDVVKDADGKPVTLADGKAQTVKKGWRVHHNQHWMVTDVDSMEATVDEQAGKIDFKLGKTHAEPSQELNKLVDTSIKGAAELAAKVGAAIATSGGSVAGEAGAALLKNAISDFIAKGGDAAKATVECADGSCTISDGVVSEVCENCIDK